MTPEQRLFEYLSNNLAVPVTFVEHDGLPDSYVVVERVGGAIESHIRRVSFAIQSLAGSLLAACVLNDRVIQAMQDLISEDWVSSVILDSDYNYTDTNTKKYRYQAIFDLILFY